MSRVEQIINIVDNNLEKIIENLNYVTLNEDITIDLSDYQSARSHVMATLTAFIHNNRRNNQAKIELLYPNNINVHNYMARMKFYEVNDIEVIYPYSQYPSDGRFIEITTFDNNTQDQVINDITNCLSRLQVSDNMQRALAFTFTELIDNVCSHAASNIGGIISAQNFPTFRELHLTIVDCGIGIPKSLNNKHSSCIGLDDDEILAQSVKRNVSSKLNDKDRGHMGMGLYKLNKIAQRSNGELNIYSNYGILNTKGGNTVTKKSKKKWPGTIVHVVLPYLTEDKWKEIFDYDMPLVPHLDPDDFF